MVETENLEEMIVRLERTGNPTPENKQHLAAAYAAVGRLNDCKALCENVLRTEPEAPYFLVQLGALYLHNDDQKAHSLFLKVFNRAKVHPTKKNYLSLALLNMGILGEKNRFYSMAHDMYNTALKVMPSNKLAEKYILELEQLADPDHGLIGMCMRGDTRCSPEYWDGSYFKPKRKEVDISIFKLE